MQIEINEQEIKEKFLSVIFGYKNELAKIITNYANANILNQIKVPYYGQMLQISQVSTISVPGPTEIIIKPFEKELIKEILKGITDSNLNLNAHSETNLIRIKFEPLTEEVRKETVKKIKKVTESNLVKLRNVRREEQNLIKKAQHVSESEKKINLEKIDKLFFHYQDILIASEKEKIDSALHFDSLKKNK
ncbi:ribosome recycling factor [symbiont of Argiope bruennichi]|uniref:ribosome-recycling factor n=1 Tax=symbiont of Argiope bruennichi TaxID=2810479 RepID=UPI003DA28E57